MRILRYGSRGPLVQHLQTLLGLPADGVFGTGTLATVKSAQAAHGLTPDGTVGDLTWVALGEAPVAHTTFDGIKGFDASHYQGAIDFVAAKAAGARFVILKATESIGLVDAEFEHNCVCTLGANETMGAYHFAHPRRDPLKQAAHALSVWEPDNTDLPWTLDFESDGGGMPARDLVQWAQTWLREVDSKTGRTSLFYSYWAFILHALGDTTELSGWPLFEGRYGKAPGPVAGWPQGPLLWQRTPHGTLDGVTGHVDLDTFEGDEAAFAKLLEATA